MALRKVSGRTFIKLLKDFHEAIKAYIWFLQLD